MYYLLRPLLIVDLTVCIRFEEKNTYKVTLYETEFFNGHLHLLPDWQGQLSRPQCNEVKEGGNLSRRSVKQGARQG